jgi:hypothetical protein
MADIRRFAELLDAPHVYAAVPEELVEEVTRYLDRLGIPYVVSRASEVTGPV